MQDEEKKYRALSIFTIEQKYVFLLTFREASKYFIISYVHTLSDGVV